MELEQNQSQHFVEQVERFEDAQKKRAFGRPLKIISVASEQMALITSCLELKTHSKSFLIALEGALKGICIERSALGFVSTDFEKIVESIVSVINEEVYDHKADLGTRKLLKYYTEMVLILSIGTTSLGVNATKKEMKEKQDRDQILEELFIGLVYTTDFVKIILKEIAESLLASKDGVIFMASIWESIAIAALLIGYAQTGATLAANLVEMAFGRLQADLMEIDQLLGGKLEREEIDVQRLGFMRSFLQQIIFSLENQDRENFVNSCLALLGTYHFSKDKLKQDCERIQKMFTLFIQALDAGKSHGQTAIQIIA